MSQLAHSNSHPGLMAKSIGPTYPLIVSYRGGPFVTGSNKDEGYWYVWNGCTGKASSFVYRSCKAAHGWAEAIKAGINATSAEDSHYLRNLSGSSIDELAAIPNELVIQ